MSDGFADFMDSAAHDGRVVGVVLGGSRGKGLGTERSDWDVYVVVDDVADTDDVRSSLDVADARVELCAVIGLTEFAGYAGLGQPEEWNRYTFAHVTPSLDRTGGRLKALCEDKEWLPEAVARTRATVRLDAYLNSVYRSLKNGAEGNRAGARLDAAESVTHVLDFVFTAERRVRPYNKYLAWELTAHPLEGMWWPEVDPLPLLMAIIARAPADHQAAVFRTVEARARSLGYATIFDAWDTAALAALRTGTSNL